jgi:hypothetical protein
MLLLLLLLLPPVVNCGYDAAASRTGHNGPNSAWVESRH